MKFMRLAAGALVFVAVATSAKPMTEDAQAVINLRDFDFVVDKITANYAGYDTKVTDANRDEFAALTARLRTQAGAASDEQLNSLLTEWVNFFKDGHTRISRRAPVDTATATTASTAETQRVDWTETTVRRRLAALGRHRDPLEGIWRISGDRYRVGVLRAGAGTNTFVAAVLTTTSEAWAPGQVKAMLNRTANGALTATYRIGDHNHTPLSLSGELVANGELLKLSENLGVWTREWPAPLHPDAAARLFPSDELFLRRLSPTTFWLRIPDFDDGRFAPLKAALAAQADALATAPNLIIDLRNNGGGSDYVYGPISPLIYTRPVYSVGVELRATADNVALRREIIPKIVDSPDTVTQLQAQIRLMEQNLGKYVQPDRQPFSISRQEAVLPFPKRVAVLIDGAGSTGEQFLLEARQSHKVTLFGQRNSAGILDFANVVDMDSPSGRFHLQWATSRSLRVPDDPVDPDGIAPDVRVPDTERDPVRFAQRWLERQIN